MTRAYEVVSGVVFAAVAVAQALRAARAWPLRIDAWSIPVWQSWVVALVAASLSAWAFRRAMARRR
jgi:sterol desaturase/sphingolipid hydroxylase (fatty acid hydroxylase superfamily)